MTVGRFPGHAYNKLITNNKTSPFELNPIMNKN